jgi:pilus assembly protein CpaB
MNITRIAILGVAAIAAGAAALLVRGMLGGGTPEVAATPAPQLATTEILVASRPIEAGRALDAEAVRWVAWPQTAVTPELITKEANPELDKVVEGAVTRAPLVEGEPLTESKYVRADSANFVAATLTPGNRAVSIPVTAETGAGGFILPNDRVDVILTREAPSLLNVGGAPNIETVTILRDVRVIGIDQIVKQEEDQQAVVAKTATLEVTPAEAELVAQADALGTLSVALRALGDDVEVTSTGLTSLQQTTQSGRSVMIFRYGLGSTTGGIRPQ